MKKEINLKEINDMEDKETIRGEINRLILEMLTENRNQTITRTEDLFLQINLFGYLRLSRKQINARIQQRVGVNISRYKIVTLRDLYNAVFKKKGLPIDKKVKDLKIKARIVLMMSEISRDAEGNKEPPRYDLHEISLQIGGKFFKIILSQPPTGYSMNVLALSDSHLILNTRE